MPPSTVSGSRRACRPCTCRRARYIAAEIRLTTCPAVFSAAECRKASRNIDIAAARIPAFTSRWQRNRGHIELTRVFRTFLSGVTIHLEVSDGQGKRQGQSGEGTAWGPASEVEQKAELKKVTEERYILRKAAAYFAKELGSARRKRRFRLTVDYPASPAQSSTAPIRSWRA